MRVMFGRIPRRGYVRVGKIVTRPEGGVSLSISLSLSLSLPGQFEANGIEAGSNYTLGVPGEVIPASVY